MPTRVCRRCEVEKPISDYVDPNHYHICRDCIRKATRVRYAPPAYSLYRTMQFIYIAQGVKGGDVKIGWSKNPDERRKQIPHEKGNPLRLIATMEGTQQHEYQIHEQLLAFETKREWFTPCQAIVDLIHSDGWTVHNELIINR